MSFNLTDSNCIDYLASRGMVQREHVRSVELLGWGVSNTLVKVCTTDDCLVVKQSLPQLRVSGDWYADRQRIFRERACIDTLAGILPPGTIPEVRYEDRGHFLFVMSCAPAEGYNWKERLLEGHVNLKVASKVGAMLGIVHRATAGVEPVRREFIDHQPFIQLRIDPYHWTTAQMYPDLAGAIDREARRMLEVKSVLVHGDYSPKNIIVTGENVFLLDFEVVHYGNPVFDLAFMLSHLLLKSVHRRAIRSQYFYAVEAFWQGYAQETAGGPPMPPFGDSLERDTIKQLGCLLLARIDGKSPVEYIVEPEVKELVRGVARSLLCEQATTLSEVLGLVDERLG